MAEVRSRRNVLALNCGSSSLKFGLFTSDGITAQLVFDGEAEEIGRESSTFPDHAAALRYALDALKKSGAPAPGVIGHRFVHGGPRLREHQRLTPQVADTLRASVAYAPLHLPAALTVLEAVERDFPQLAQVICLDTAFHRTMPAVSRTFALPAEVRDLGVERYGFHGLSLESIVAQLDPIPKRLIVAHLGNGSSITAIRDGASIDTTMGLTPTGGVMMGTRCGDLDPGAVIYLLRNGYPAPESLETLFDHHSGLLGLSGKTSDVRELSKLRAHDKQVDLALRMFCYQVRKAIAAMTAALGGLDMLVFTGGIGEHASELRVEICDGLEFFGIGNQVPVMVLPSQEDAQIAVITARLALES